MGNPTILTNFFPKLPQTSLCYFEEEIGDYLRNNRLGKKVVIHDGHQMFIKRDMRREEIAVRVGVLENREYAPSANKKVQKILVVTAKNGENFGGTQIYQFCNRKRSWTAYKCNCLLNYN